MKRIFKKLMALTLVLAMVGSTMAMAATQTTGEQTSTGTGSMEDYVAPEADIFTVELPTTAGFAFVLDPQGLIDATKGAAYDELKLTSTTGVYFANYNAAGQIAAYSEFSDVMAIVNRGNLDVTVDLTALVTASEGLNVVDTAAAAVADNNANVYLGVEIGTVDADGKFTETSEVDATATDAAAVFTAQAVAAAHHTKTPEYKWNEEDGYYTEYPADDKVTYSGLYFRVTGAVNTTVGAADAWNELLNGEDAPEFSVSMKLAWTITTAEDTTATFEDYVKPYTVTFEMGTWGTDFTQEVKGDNNSYATEPDAPDVEGYDFVGWYADAEFSAPFDFEGTKITNNTTVVYAQYAPAVGVRNFTATLSLNANQTATVVLPAGATGITSITEENGTLVASSRYALDTEAGTLTLLGTYLRFLTEGTHTYTVVFNDTDATTVTFTVTVTAPTPDPDPAG